MYQDENYLMHYGVKGMKWGVRHDKPSNPRFVAAKGKAKVAADKGFTRSIKTNKGGKISPAERSMSDIQKITTEAAHISENASRVKKRKMSTDVSKMSDAELRTAINRMNLERQYRSLESERISTGHDRATEILKNTGAIVGIASGLVGITATIYELKKG